MSLPSPSQTTVEANSSIGLWYLDRDEILRLVAHGGGGEGFLGVAARLFGLLDREGIVALGLQIGDGFLLLYSTRTSEAAKRAISHSSATTSATGWPLNMILSS